MVRNKRNFNDREADERAWLEEHTWCDICDQADLGLNEPREYEEAGEVFVEGKCRKCGNRVASQILEEIYEEPNE